MITKLLIYFILTFLISLTWVKFSKIYTYRKKNIFILGINFWAVVWWVAGLFSISILYELFSFKYKLIVLIILYWAGLLVSEYIGYHILNIKLETNHPGLFGLNIIHVNNYSKVYYILIGPVFLLLITFLNRLL